MANEEKPELSTKIKQTCHNYKEELPVLTKMLNVIEGKNVVKSEEKSETAGQTVPVKTENMKMINSKENVLNGENIKETVQIDEKKPLSMMVGEEMIQIEVASNNSDEESESETQKNVNNSAPVSDKSVKLEGDHISGTAKHTGSSMKENVGKHEKTVKVSEVVQNRVSEYLKQSLQSSKLKAKSGQELPHAPVIDLTAEKQMVKALYTPKSSAINTSMPNIVLLPAGNSSHLPVNQRSLLVSTTPAVPVSNVQTTVSSVADLLRTIYVPTSVPSTMRTTLPASGVQFKTLNSVLASPVVSSRSSTYPVIGNMPGLRMILQNKPSGGPVTLPYIQTNAPRIIYAPSPRPTIITLQKPGIVGSSHIIQGKSMQNSSTPKQGNDTAVKSLLAKSLATPLNQNLQTAKMNTVVQPNVVNKGIIPTTVLQSSDMKKKEPTVSVHNVTIVIGRDGVHYDKATGKPYVYPPDQKYVIAGPKGKFYDRATGYEVNVPHSENLKHVPGTVYLASGVSFTQEALKKIMAKKRAKTKKVKKQKEEITTSDEEFEKMLDLEKSSGDENDDTNYDYEKISQHVRAAKDKKLPARRASLKTSDSEKEEDNGSNVENVPVKLGRNAKRAAARKCTNYAESLGQLNFTEEIIEEEAAVEEPCKACNKNEDPSTILLCDKCDGSYHMSCLSPPLSLVPLEDWFCPQCEHNMLIESLREKVKEVKKAKRRFSRGQDRISVKTFSIDSENILEVERRSCRTKREVSYNEANYDKMIQKAVKEMNKPKEDRSSSDSSDSETESDTKQTSKPDHKQQKKGKATKRQRDGTRKSRRVKKSSSSGKSKAKRRKLTSLEDDSGGSSTEYLESEGSESSDTEGPAPDQEDMAVGGIYFTSSGRKTKNVSYT
ncbi:remodeling and spacing factor 1-like [Mercenaria mercenaria]|uniref:remodeling and spacing factor 1-like n=1 Tax=Mercenaria mercenaria TaxID=6596 RepID=UPI00234F5D3D|nr:remodeling and spacing factor 1-like [Mercenaria mercenaria]